MPVRLLREGILDSERVNRLSLGGEVFYRRLMSCVDDFGRFDGRPSVIRARLYPLRLDSVTEDDVAEWIDECEQAGLIRSYAVDGKPFLVMFNLRDGRAKSSKYPSP